jgi:colicin import membrane protein
MARKLKTFVTILGFFELAIAAPSMKAALEHCHAGQFIIPPFGILRRCL